MRAPPSLLSLPPELLDLVLRLCTDASLVRVGATSRRLFLLAARVRWTAPLPLLSAAAKRNVCAGVVVARLSACAPLVARLAFPEPSPAQMLLVFAAGRVFAELVELDLGGLDQFAVTDYHISLITRVAPRLRSLLIPDCVSCTDVSLRTLANFHNIAAFTHLSLDRCCEMSDDGLIPLLQKMPNLLYLSLNLVPLATPAVTYAIASTCSKLETLIWQIATVALQAELNEMDVWRHMERVELAGDCFSVVPTLRKQEKIPKSTWKFKSLKLNGLAAITDKSLLALTTGIIMNPSDFIAINTVKSGPKVDMQVLELSNLINISNTSFAALSLSLYPNTLKHLDLSRSTFPAEIHQEVAASLSTLFKSQHFINTLNLSGGLSGAITDHVCTAIAANLSNLENLDMSECHAITDDGTSQIASSCRSLKTINWKGCTPITDLTIESFFSPTSPPASLHLSSLLTTTKLHTLKLSGCHKITDKTLTSLTSASPHPSLKLLCFSGCANLSPLRINSLTNTLPFLESINLYSLPNVSNQCIQELSRACPRIVSLVVSKCPVGDAAALAIAKGCKRIHTLYMSFLTAPVGESLTDVGVSAIIEECPSLKLLDVSRCEGLTDKAFCVGSGEVGVQVLVLRACQGVTGAGVEWFVKTRGRRLLTVDVVGCVGISGVERERVRELVEGR
ncbi:RNI-like protein [Rhizoclosmatium globosum]|uniref:RNI-like protein n=1 Tax=Rhizoclosmatium globosum TaxID=329046 RepID=A0A1Y2CFF4_9FUNG|nr:RNI-like protein [Rhizoclosmatium globosum]|eukprot:ORY45656.1 RNI-like protein [Rhizoclosmatium globosum]